MRKMSMSITSQMRIVYMAVGREIPICFDAKSVFIPRRSDGRDSIQFRSDSVCVNLNVVVVSRGYDS